MPNYCFNTLTISGNQKNLNDFLTKNENIEEGEELDFSKSVPVPSDCYMGDLGPDERKQYGSNNWYDVQTKIWGTKWNCSNVSMTRDKDTLTYTFSTAWSPPKSWLITTAKKFDELIFKLEYEESGCDYYGTLSIEYGDITEDITGEISEVITNVFNQIDKDVSRIIKYHFSSKNDALKILSEKTSIPECEGNNYEGWKNCKGKYTAEDGSEYIGYFKDGKIEEGSAKYPGGSKYVGKFKNNKPHGQRTFTYTQRKNYL